MIAGERAERKRQTRAFAWTPHVWLAYRVQQTAQRVAPDQWLLAKGYEQ
jgi:hypothetical protein